MAAPGRWARNSARGSGGEGAELVGGSGGEPRGARPAVAAGRARSLSEAAVESAERRGPRGATVGGSRGWRGGQWRGAQPAAAVDGAVGEGTELGPRQRARSLSRRATDSQQWEPRPAQRRADLRGGRVDRARQVTSQGDARGGRRGRSRRGEAQDAARVSCSDQWVGALSS
ncbi:hypothetical protein T492DRAFT_1088776 [Pavlovales sp. CCMP2436]|nr:hypothetical protein T492DRAFT_1088776 [Pavlovales sp. CCMP2436]